MFYFMKPLPKDGRSLSGWTPFIRSGWFRRRFMRFVYLLQAVVLFLSVTAGAWDHFPLGGNLLLFLAVYLCHELLHIATVCRKGNLSLSHSGIFLWLNTDAVLSKWRFWLFMTLPLLALSGVPLLLSLCVPRAFGKSFYGCLELIGWANLLIGGSDLINSVLILLKPVKTQFCRGFYRLRPSVLENEGILPS